MVRKFLAKRLVNLLIDHGNLDAQIRELRRKQEEEELEFLESIVGPAGTSSSMSLKCHEARICHASSTTASSSSGASPMSSPDLISSASEAIMRGAFGESPAIETSLVMLLNSRTMGSDADPSQEATDTTPKFLELPHPQSSSSWPKPISSIHNFNWDDEDAARNGFGQVERVHSMFILVTSLVIVRHFKNKNSVSTKTGAGSPTIGATHEKKKWQPPPSRRTKCADIVKATSLLLARTSFCLVTSLLVVNSLPSPEKLDQIVYWIKQYPSVNGRLVHQLFQGVGAISKHASQLLVEGRLPWNRIVFRSALWSLLISITPESVSTIWDVLNPAKQSTTISSLTKKFNNIQEKSWQSKLLAIAEIASIVCSVGMVSWLSYLDLPLFRNLANGNILQQIGFNHETNHFLQQVLSSFLAYCIFAKFLPTSPSAPSTTPQDRQEVATKTSTHLKNKYGSANPAIVQRMATLAQEARVRVEQRKKLLAQQQQQGGSAVAGARLTRSYSVATFNPDKYHEEENIASPRKTGRGAGSARGDDGIDRSPILCPSSVGGPRKLLNPRKHFMYESITPISSPFAPRNTLTPTTFVPPPPLSSALSSTDVVLTPTPIRIRRHRPSLTSLPEQHQPPPPSPLLDIHKAGPSHSSKDVFANLKRNNSLRHCHSTGNLENLTELPQSLYLPFSNGGNKEEEKYVDDVDDSDEEGYDRVSALPMQGPIVTTTSPPLSPIQNDHAHVVELAFKSNPQSASTPVPEKHCLA